MDQATHNRIVSFLWGIADDVLRDLFKRGKYPDVILPMAVLRRLFTALEPTKARVLKAKQKLDAAEIKEQDAALRAAAGQAFYNVSPFVLRDLTTRDSEQIPLLEAGGIEAFIRREVLPYSPNAWVSAEATKVGYEVSFTRHFYKPKPLRSLAEIAADIRAIEQEAEGLLDGLPVGPS